MAVVSEREFRRLLGGLDTDGFARFVADLWAARGYDTAVDGRTVRARAGGEETVLELRHDASLWRRLRAHRRRDGGADVVVTSGAASAVDPPAGTEVVGAGDLYTRALYGVDLDERRDLFERHFGRPPTRTGAEGPVTRSRALGGVAAVALVVFAVAAAAGPLAPAGETAAPVADPLATAGDGGPPATPTPAAAKRQYASATPTTAARTTTPPDDGHRAVDLAYAHADILDRTSFTVEATQTWTGNGTEGRSVLVGAFGPNRTRYAITLVQNGSLVREFDAEWWANDSRVLRAVTAGNDTTYSVLRDARGIPVRPREALFFDPVYVEDLPALLAAIESSEVELRERDPPVDDQQWAPATVRNILGRSPTEDPLVFELRATLSEPAVADIEGQREGAVENATLTAIVDSQGRFYRYTLTYDTTIAGDAVRVRSRVRFSGVGSTTPTRPAWYDRVANATDAVAANATADSYSSRPRM